MECGARFEVAFAAAQSAWSWNAGQSGWFAQPLKGRLILRDFKVSLKRYPDTKLEFFSILRSHLPAESPPSRAPCRAIFGRVRLSSAVNRCATQQQSQSLLFRALHALPSHSLVPR